MRAQERLVAELLCPSSILPGRPLREQCECRERQDRPAQPESKACCGMGTALNTHGGMGTALSIRMKEPSGCSSQQGRPSHSS